MADQQPTLAQSVTPSLALCYCPCPDADTAQRLAGTIVEHRLAACVNILAPCSSVYVWDGKTCNETEVPLLCKTTIDRLAALREYLEAQHPYDTPAIVGWPVAEAPAAFTAWVEQQTFSRP